MQDWCRARSFVPGAVVPPRQLWDLSQGWYEGRFDLGWRPRTAAEARSRFQAAGLTGDFWAV